MSAGATQEENAWLENFLASHVTDPTPKRSECMYCGDVISQGAEPVSHGVCAQCHAEGEFRAGAFFSPQPQEEERAHG